jgi:MFS family permease
MFICARLILGMGIPFAIIGASSLLGELSYPKERPFMTSIFNASWFVGSIAAAATTLGTFAMPNDWSWRIPSAIQGFPSLIQIFTILYLVPYGHL